MLSVSDFRERFPEFDSVADARVQLVLDQAERRVGPERFGDLWLDAIGYFTAHLLAKSAQARDYAQGASGPITSKTVGSVSVSYAASGTNFDLLGLDSTPYGVEYQLLCKLVTMGGLVV
jgi:hypothetical protein